MKNLTRQERKKLAKKHGETFQPKYKAPVKTRQQLEDDNMTLLEKAKKYAEEKTKNNGKTVSIINKMIAKNKGDN